MHASFKVISISHKTAPIEVRERLALNPEETVCVLEYGKEATAVKFKYTRGFPIDDFSFAIGSDGLPRTMESNEVPY